MSQGLPRFQAFPVYTRYAASELCEGIRVSRPHVAAQLTFTIKMAQWGRPGTEAISGLYESQDHMVIQTHSLHAIINEVLTRRYIHVSNK